MVSISNISKYKSCEMRLLLLFPNRRLPLDQVTLSLQALRPLSRFYQTISTFFMFLPYNDPLLLFLNFFEKPALSSIHKWARKRLPDFLTSATFLNILPANFSPHIPTISTKMIDQTTRQFCTVKVLLGRLGFYRL